MLASDQLLILLLDSPRDVSRKMAAAGYSEDEIRVIHADLNNPTLPSGPSVLDVRTTLVSQSKRFLDLVLCPDCSRVIFADTSTCPYCGSMNAGRRGVERVVEMARQHPTQELLRTARSLTGRGLAFAIDLDDWPVWLAKHPCWPKRAPSLRFEAISRGLLKGEVITFRCAHCESHFEFNLGLIGFGVAMVDRDVVRWFDGGWAAIEPRWVTSPEIGDQITER